MDQFNSLCSCLIASFQQSLQTVEAIVSGTANQQITTSQGHDASAVTLGLPRPTSQYGESISSVGLLMMTMIVLFILMLLSIRSDSARERRREQRRRLREDGLIDKQRRDDSDSRGDGGGLH